MPAVTTHQTMLDQRQVHQLRFNICRRYVFATRGNQQVFFTTRHIQVAITIKMTEVTAVQPAVYQGLRRLITAPQIALKNVRSMHQDLTVVSDAHLRSRQWLAYRTDTGTADQADGSRSAIFGLAVNLADHQIKTSKELTGFRRNRRGGRDQQTCLVQPERLLNFMMNQPGGQCLLQPQQHTRCFTGKPSGMPTLTHG